MKCFRGLLEISWVFVFGGWTRGHKTEAGLDDSPLPAKDRPEAEQPFRGVAVGRCGCW